MFKPIQKYNNYLLKVAVELNICNVIQLFTSFIVDIAILTKILIIRYHVFFVHLSPHTFNVEDAPRCFVT